MKKLFYLLLISLLVNSCEKKSTPNCPDTEEDCTTIRCLITNYAFNFRVIDKNTGTDLVFGPSPRYNVADIALYQDATHTIPISLTTDAGKKIFTALQATSEMHLVIANTTSYKLNVDFRKLECCLYQVKNLSVNGQSICTCCADAIEVPVQ